MPAAYLPEVWNDDSKMHSLMSVIKERSVNSVDYDRKVKFWSETIAASCEGEKNALFNVDLLKRRFRRGDRIPAGIQVVVDSLKKNGRVVSISDWRSMHSGWLGWGLSKTRSWMFGGSEDDRLIHLPTLYEQAAQILQIYNDELRSEVDCSGEVIAYAELFEKASKIINNVESFDLVLEHLVDIGELTIGSSGNGDKILKFKDLTSKDPVQFTEADASLHDIRRAMNRVEREISNLETKANKLDQQCRTSLRAGEKGKAANLLRQKKRVEKDMGEKDGQYQRLLTMLHQLSSAKHNKEVLNAYQAGTAAFKATLSRHGLSPDKVDETMDDVASSLDDYREIEDAMSKPSMGTHFVSDDDLEQELNDLMKGSKEEKEMPQLPDVPATNRVGLFDEDPAAISIEKRLERLRHAV